MDDLLDMNKCITVNLRVRWILLGVDNIHVEICTFGEGISKLEAFKASSLVNDISREPW